ncbi:MAG: hypothetical protein U0797_27545 [Gemmataceae bacterium]
MANPLDSVIQWYTTANDSIRVTRRVLTKGIKSALPKKHAFLNRPAEECSSLLDSGADELKRVVVLALTAIFERTLRDHLTEIPKAMLPPGDPHHDAVREQLIADIEFWNISARVLDVFPGVAAEVRGEVKQISEYRNWVAHGHTVAKPAPSNVIPEKAYERLTRFLDQAGLLSP